MSSKGRRKRKPSQRRKDTPVEDLFEAQLKEEGIAGWSRETTFIPGRKFRADFYFDALKLDVEIDGGIFLPYGSHSTGEGITKDRERDALALLHGILPVRYTSGMVRDKTAVAHLKELIPLRRAQIEAQGGSS